MELLARAAMRDGDEIIALGDIVDRGPDSLRVLDFFRTTPNARSLLGNHEWLHVRSFRGEGEPDLSQVIARSQIGAERYPEMISFMAGFVHAIELPDAILVHGCWEPGKTLDQQDPAVIMGSEAGELYLTRKYSKPWYELYDGPKPLIVGHHNYSKDGRPSIWNDRVYGIDAACCHGGALTGLLLPEFRLVRVPSRGDYWREAKREYSSAARGISSHGEI